MQRGNPGRGDGNGGLRPSAEELHPPYWLTYCCEARLEHRRGGFETRPYPRTTEILRLRLRMTGSRNAEDSHIKPFVVSHAPFVVSLSNLAIGESPLET